MIAFMVVGRSGEIFNLVYFNVTGYDLTIGEKRVLQ